MKPDEFLNQMLPGALATQRSAGIPASFTLAQAALESSWGARAPGNNLFGMKADTGWHGPTVDVPTHEVVHGQSVAMTCKFRAYGSWAESVADHARFLLENRRYAKCFIEKSGEGWARAVAAAGYATDPAYADKLIATIRARNLSRFETPLETPCAT